MYVAPGTTEIDLAKLTVACRATVAEINTLQVALITMIQRFKHETRPMPLSGTTTLELLIRRASNRQPRLIEHLSATNKKVYGVAKKGIDRTNPLTPVEFVLISTRHDEQHCKWIIDTLELFKRQYLTPGSKPMAIVKPNHAALTDAIVVVDQ